MPEFIATLTPSITDLDQFTRDYLEAAEWLLPEPQDDEEAREATGFSPEFIKQAIEDCADFQEANADALVEYQDLTGYTGGVDFWLTRNGHGAGFWDRGTEPVFTALTDSAHVYGGIDHYVGDDGLIYGA